MGGYISTVNFSTLVVGTITGGTVPGGIGSLSELSIDVSKDWAGFGITNFGTLSFANSAKIYGDGTGTIKASETLHILGDLIVDGAYPSGISSSIIVDGNTLTGKVTIASGLYTTIGVTGSLITIGSTIPNLQDLTGTITVTQHNITHAWGDISGKPYIVNEVIVDSSTIQNTIVLVQGNNMGLSVNGNSIIFTAGLTGSYISTIMADGNTLSGRVTFDVGQYSTIGVSGELITIGSTVPTLQQLTGTLLNAQHGSLNTGNPHSQYFLDTDTISLAQHGSVATGDPHTQYVLVAGDTMSYLKVNTTLNIGTVGNSYIYEDSSLQLRTNANVMIDGWLEVSDGLLTLQDVLLSRYGVSTLSTSNMYLTGNLICDGNVPQSIDVDAVTVGSVSLTNTIIFTEGNQMNITTSGQSIIFNPDLSDYTGSLSALVINAEKDWQGHGIGNLGGVTINGADKKLVFDTQAGSESTFPLVFPITIGVSAGYSEIYVSGDTLIVDSNLRTTGTMKADGYLTSNNSIGLDTVAIATNKTLTFEDGLLIRADNHTMAGSIITSMAFAYVGTFDTGTNVSPVLLTPCSMDLIHVKAIVKTACTSGSITVDVNKDGTSVFTTQSNRPALLANSLRTTSGAPNITSLPEDSTISIDLDTVGNTIGTDITVILKCRQGIVFN